VQPAAGVDSAWHLLVARVAQRDRVRARLVELGVETGIHYPVLCPEQPAFAKWSDGAFPSATRAAGEIVSLPLHPHMDVDDVDRVCRALSAVLTPED